MDFEVDSYYDSLSEVLNEIDCPKDYKVILFNDDYTTMEFVIQILIGVFHKSEYEAVELTQTVHCKGSAVIGVYPYDIAVTRAALTIQSAKKQGFPLRCEVEEV